MTGEERKVYDAGLRVFDFIYLIWRLGQAGCSGTDTYVARPGREMPVKFWSGNVEGIYRTSGVISNGSV
jgi:hypothetical protein